MFDTSSSNFVGSRIPKHCVGGDSLSILFEQIGICWSVSVELFAFASKLYSYASFADRILIVVPALTTMLGATTVVFSLLGCWGMAVRNRISSIIYFIAMILIIFAEIGIGGWWAHVYKRYNIYPMLKIFFYLEREPEYDQSWLALQIQVKDSIRIY